MTLACTVRFPLLLGLLAAMGCQNSTQRALQVAQRDGLEASIVEGAPFRHQLFTRMRPAETLYVFIEGDGVPWISGGTRLSRDPTPHRALALKLAASTAHALLYVGRPCYFAARSDLRCTPAVWTSERYSAVVVASMAAVVNRYAGSHGNPQVVLIGYSGGGALAVLMAPRIPTTRAVVTIAANLDSDAWARWHGYSPLAGSLNAALQSPLPDAIRQWHLVGGLDANVPEKINAAYFRTLHADQLWRYPQFDHRCCWVEHWPSILARIEAAIGERGG